MHVERRPRKGGKVRKEIANQVRNAWLYEAIKRRPSEQFNINKSQQESWCLFSWNGPSAVYPLSMGGDWSLSFLPCLLLMPYLAVTTLAKLSLVSEEGWGAEGKGG